MNRTAGSMLAILVVASFLAGSSGSRSASYPQSGNGEEHEHAQGKKIHGGAKKQRPGAGWYVPPDPRCFLIRTIGEFYGGHEPVPSGSLDDAYAEVPDGCNPKQATGRNRQVQAAPGQQVDPRTWGIPENELKKPIRFVIATVPDPLRSHLSLFFDRSIDAIQQATQSAGYLFSHAGMPWDPEEHDPPADLDTKLLR